MGFNYFPVRGGVQDDKGQITKEWTEWFRQLYSICHGISESGPSNRRPTKGLYVGKRYFDVDLRKPVYILQVAPIIWVDSSGNVV